MNTDDVKGVEGLTLEGALEFAETYQGPDREAEALAVLAREIRRMRSLPSQSEAVAKARMEFPYSVKRWINLLADWEDNNGTMAGIVQKEWETLIESMANLAVEVSPRMARNDMENCHAQAQETQEG